MLRSRNVGASEVAALDGSHPYKTALSLWASKTGRDRPDEDTRAMKRGRKLEPVAIEIIRRQNTRRGN